jgi:hypothetical protein
MGKTQRVEQRTPCAEAQTAPTNPPHVGCPYVSERAVCAERIARLEALLENHLSETRKDLKQIRGKLDGVDNMLRGDPDQNGVIVRVDRLEQISRTLRMLLVSVWGAFVVSLFSGIVLLVVKQSQE